VVSITILVMLLPGADHQTRRTPAPRAEARGLVRVGVQPGRFGDMKERPMKDTWHDAIRRERIGEFKVSRVHYRRFTVGWHAVAAWGHAA